MITTTAEITVSVPVPVSERTLSDLLITAFEGGSDYWIRHITLFDRQGKETRHLTDNPVRSLASIVILDDDTGTGHQLVMPIPAEVTPSQMVATFKKKAVHHLFEDGLTVMAKEHPRHFGELVADTGDATTADVFLQCCLFGKVLYG